MWIEAIKVLAEQTVNRGDAQAVKYPVAQPDGSIAAHMYERLNDGPLPEDPIGSSVIDSVVSEWCLQRKAT